ncbi:N-acetylglucosamine-6-phosphate deacetylase [Bhargavaea ginsengi]|uniref:N-acetylglucosamine-6-phosphate deacetylase n=1 Tax=Bhargavaea ginsengi TaxID=426757 RepID=A0A1H6TTW4_9BACL|nr:N-acetylglucosamine-6-phosphate deacetylase [Bhargavaea ginsengi]SEI83503.1 N-acetylglucosamine-6-phosphate deacetylase [Bhargavaea ginsengi]
MGTILISGAKIYAEEGVLEAGYVLVRDGEIADVSGSRPAELPDDTLEIDGTSLNLLPGFIDVHIHGADGADVMDATEEALDRMARFLPAEGTTAFLATTITQSHENIGSALENVAQYPNRPGQAEVLGVHLEGPFVEKKRAGAQPESYIIEPDAELFRKWQEMAGGRISVITMAPEHDRDGAFIRELSESGVVVSAGHTDTGFVGMQDAAKHGVSQVTHLCNAMPGIHHRDVGVVGAAFILDSLKAELIADGIHVEEQMLRLIWQNIGPERLILITDSMRAKGLPAGDYELGGQPVRVTEDRAELADGTLAGSILKMNEGARRMLGIEGVTMEDIVAMASRNPARQLGVDDRKGGIREGKDADLILADDNLNIRLTLCRGEVAFEA